jgi:hypothetical protein
MRVWKHLCLVSGVVTEGKRMYRPLQLNRATRRALEFVVAVTAALLGSYLILRSPW